MIDSRGSMKLKAIAVLLILLSCVTLYGRSNVAVTLASHLALSDFPNSPNAAHDCWGFTDGQGREYAIIGLNNETSFVNITDPFHPKIVGVIPAPDSIFRDMRV